MYAKILMDKLETRLLQGAEEKPHTWWRFIDNIFIIRTEEEEKLNFLTIWITRMILLSSHQSGLQRGLGFWM